MQIIFCFFNFMSNLKWIEGNCKFMWIKDNPHNDNNNNNDD